MTSFGINSHDSLEYRAAATCMITESNIGFYLGAEVKLNARTLIIFAEKALSIRDRILMRTMRSHPRRRPSGRRAQWKRPRAPCTVLLAPIRPTGACVN